MSLHRRRGLYSRDPAAAGTRRTDGRAPGPADAGLAADGAASALAQTLSAESSEEPGLDAFVLTCDTLSLLPEAGVSWGREAAIQEPLAGSAQESKWHLIAGSRLWGRSESEGWFHRTPLGCLAISAGLDGEVFLEKKVCKSEQGRAGVGAGPSPPSAPHDLRPPCPAPQEHWGDTRPCTGQGGAATRSPVSGTRAQAAFRPGKPRHIPGRQPPSKNTARSTRKFQGAGNFPLGRAAPKPRGSPAWRRVQHRWPQDPEGGHPPHTERPQLPSPPLAAA